MAYNRWTDAERAVIHQFLDICPDPPFGYTHDLSDLLPGRSVQDIRNGVNMIRRQRLGICQCGQLTSGSRCPTCTEARRRDRSNRLAQGLCALCGNNLNEHPEGASATLCATCRERRHRYRPAAAERFKDANPTRRPKHDPLACLKVVSSWPSCGHARWIAEVASLDARPVVDLFGGTGELLRLVTVHGKSWPHAYYDLDPRITNIVQYALYPTTTTLSPEAQTLALPLTKERRYRLRVLGDTLRPTLKTIACRDAIDVLANAYDQPHNALFIADPPWPGQKHPCQATVDHAQLLDALLDLPMGQDFILSLGAERQALQLAAKHLGPGATYFWRTSGHLYAKSILALSPALAPLLADLPKINPKDFGVG